MSAAGQQVFRIKADSLLVFSNCDTAELVLKNRTSGETGALLTNKGDGFTEFRKVWLKLNDSLYRVGSDTINTNIFGRNIYKGSGFSQIKTNGKMVVWNDFLMPSAAL